MQAIQNDSEGPFEEDGSMDPWGCAERGEEEGMKRLLERSDVNDWINKGDNQVRAWTPLQWASYNGHLEVVKLLLSSRADISLADQCGKTALHLASIKGHIEVVKFLLSSGADIDCSDNVGKTPLHFASIKNHLEVVNFLLLSGADINSPDDVGRTALHLASIRGTLEVVKFYLSLGADVNRSDYDGKLALDYAINYHHMVVAETLLSAGACFRDEQNLANIRSRSEGMANVITKVIYWLFACLHPVTFVFRQHLIWRRRKSFLMFLATQKYLSRRGETSGGDQEWLETRSLSSPVHRVLMSEDMQRLLASYL